MIGSFKCFRSLTLIAAFCISQSALAAPIARFALMGDSGKKSAELDRLQRSVQSENINSLIMPGDNLYSGNYNSVWDSWKKAGFQFDVIAIGNHHGGYSKEVQYFQMPGEFYSVVKGGARFLVLNSDNTSNVKKQFDWLSTQMKSAKEKMIFLVYHHPTYTVSQDHAWNEKKEFQTEMRKFLSANGSRITALLLGHDHISTFVDFGGLPAIVAGSGRAVRDEEPVSYQQNGIQVQTRYLAPTTQHWALMEIEEGSAEATISFIRVQDQQRVCTARLAAGKMTLEGPCR